MIRMPAPMTFDDIYDVIGGQSGAVFEGRFVIAVKTTGVFCRPSCRARKPKRENVIFFETAQLAMKAGFRPCKICKPLERLDEPPQYIKDIVLELRQTPYLRIKDADLLERGIEPSRIRRWFKKHYNMTFHAYQRMLRINAAFNAIKEGETVTNAAFDSGYSSLSGFADGCRSIFGGPASRCKTRTIINIVRFTTPIGPMFACATRKGVCLAEFAGSAGLEAGLRELCKRLNAVILPGENQHLDQVQQELSEYFNGRRMKFDVSLDTPGTGFQKEIWEILRTVPFGSTLTCKQLAAIHGNPRAVRAVASAAGRNRAGIVIPCHRVIGADGALAGQGGGISRKRWLLDFEAGLV